MPPKHGRKPTVWWIYRISIVSVNCCHWYRSAKCGASGAGSAKLNLMGIETALHLAECSSWVIRKHFNVVLERTARELRGEPCLALEEFSPTKQQIICSRSFGSRITRYDDMHGRSAPMPNAPPSCAKRNSFAAISASLFAPARMQRTRFLW